MNVGDLGHVNGCQGMIETWNQACWFGCGSKREHEPMFWKKMNNITCHNKTKTGNLNFVPGSMQVEPCVGCERIIFLREGVVHSGRKKRALVAVPPPRPRRSRGQGRFFSVQLFGSTFKKNKSNQGGEQMLPLASLWTKSRDGNGQQFPG